MRKVLIAALACLSALLFFCAAAGAERAKVITPGGAANVRKKPSRKSDLIWSVPNGGVVDAQEAQDGWALITYDGRQGYMMDEYLRRASDAEGKTLYPESGVLPLYDVLTENGSPIVGYVFPWQSFTVTSVGDEWTEVRFDGKNYAVPTAQVLSQNEEKGRTEFVPMKGVACPHEVFTQMRLDAPIAAQAHAGDEVTVLAIFDNWCLADLNGTVGYIPSGVVQLTAPFTLTADAPETETGLLTAEKARNRAEKAIQKIDKSFKAKEYICLDDLVINADGFDRPVYRFAYLTKQGAYRFFVCVDAESGDVAALNDLRMFGYTQPGLTRFIARSSASFTVTVDPAMPQAGEETRITVSGAEDGPLTYRIFSGSEMLSADMPTDCRTAYFRPRESGVYRLEVACGAETQEVYLWVTEADVFPVDESSGAYTVYSQQDGWWLDKKYSRKSNLQVSGCAIFTLAHALERLGVTGENALPQNLAVTYAACLVDGGTLNASLISRAAKEFGYATKTELIKSPVDIRERFAQGAMFSFAIVKGHIALAAGLDETGTMVKIVDSAPSATLERIKNEQLYWRDDAGTLHAVVSSLSEIPGAKYYPETGGFGGLEYELPLDYVAGRGVRLIQLK